MKVFQRVSSVLCGMFLAMSMIVLNHSAVFAEDKQPEYRLQVSPAKQDIGDLKPGESYAGAFKVQNTGKNSFDFKVSASPYSVKDELYSPEYDKNSQYTDIVNWIKFSATTGHVDPNQEQEIAYTIKVPSDVPAGGQYLAITVEWRSLSKLALFSMLTFMVILARPERLSKIRSLPFSLILQYLLPRSSTILVILMLQLATS